MKGLIEYINEEARKYPLWCDVVLNIFKKSSKLNKEQISDMIISFCDVEGRLKKFSDYLFDIYPKDYLAYQPNNDEFLNKSNDSKIANQISEFILKYIVAS